MTALPDPASFRQPATDAPADREIIVWVDISEVRPGMFVHPFNREPFLLRHKADLDALKAGNVRGVFVDLARSSTPRPSRGVTRPVASPKAARPHPVAATLPPAPPASSAGEARAATFRHARDTLARLQKPVRALLDDVRLGAVVTNQAVAPIVADILVAVEQDAAAIVSLARIRDRDGFTYAHSIAVCALMANLAARMGLDRGAQQELAVAGLLHDVGKMLVPTQVLNKPGALTPGEMAQMRAHVTRGHELLGKTRTLPAAALDVCLHHHEKIDGSGYPEALAGDQISLAARMGAVCDVYDAITSNRPYKEAWTPTECLASMFTWDGHFDPAVLGAFIKSVGIYPVGSLVRMESDHLAVILAQHESDLTRPTVRLFYAIPTRTPVPYRDLILDRDNGDAVLSREDPKKWGFTDWDRQWVTMLAA